ncbi:DUF1697 domain-containing protein [Inhella proteolytica]|uniref:DUF1697 domain-containing protein n=1 Tax=Inhella proteolytica TaxID=2795029 RepID=A0A931J341_9BURK|nr:DUF1697 domain-containing protein [Inhella proteolytica]MBH9576868.1 DUF1697 domain-containing protein [Inhella proteolytica]
MKRYIALLRGVSPMNCRMPELKLCFEAAGFQDVRTLLSSGNVAFTARPAEVPVLERAAEQAMQAHWGRAFKTIVRPASFLQALVEAEPFAAFALPAEAKPIVAFLRRPYAGEALELPIRQAQAAILALAGTEVLAAYVPNAKAPAFMALLERRFGKEITTRTWDTVRKCAFA